MVRSYVKQIYSNIVEGNNTNKIKLGINLPDDSVNMCKASAIIWKERHYSDMKTLKPVHHTAFQSHLYFAFLILAHYSNFVKRLCIFQKNLKNRCIFWVEMLIQIPYLLPITLKVFYITIKYKWKARQMAFSRLAITTTCIFSD